MTRLVIGVGNAMRGDDAAGLEVVKRLRTAAGVTSTVGGVELMDLWQHVDEPIVVDAIVSGDEPGTVHRFEPYRQKLPHSAFASSHLFGLAETVELARVLGRLPEALVVFGIEAGCVQAGSEMSARVKTAVELLAAEIDHA